MSEEGELPPSPTGSDSVSYGNGHIDRDAGDDDVFVGGNEDSRNGASSNALFEYNTDGTNSDIFNDDVQLNVTGGTNSDEVNIRKSFSTPSLLTFEKQATPQATSIRRNKPVCFNCEGDHVLANCHEPRDNEKIRLAANKFKRESTGGTPRNSRETGSAGGSYGNTKFRPGRISNKLRAALGLRSDDIPSWIYRMRRLGFIDGYPPSYLKQAIVFEDDPASLLSFNFIDDKLNQKEDQADQSKSFALPTIRKEKIIWYGGYNKYFSNLYDREGNAFRIPPFESFVAQLEKDVQSRAKGDWEHQKRSRAQKRKMFSNEEASSSLLLPPPPLPTKRARMEKGEVSSTNDMSMDSTKDESLLNINEASICSSVGDESPTGLSPEFDAGIDAPDIIARPFNKTADDLGRFSQGIQPFQETIEQAQGDGKFLKSLMVLMKARRTK
ncbi:hypothetical protein QR680_012736 [Steinernema hermaphroditum]|uniref:PSP proline-rich domain-containing protein n=1 Tax=Steinernema hermaphroditum TaxID=289476 RepID=A0AA39I313_9BILA|nr:hypothetical protein QR680_012736 [Steinernema hermaphroditum]